MSPNAFPKTSVESAVGERAIFCGYLFPKRFGEGGAGELTIVERAACERGAVEYAVGEVATLEGDVNEKRTGEVAAKELAKRPLETSSSTKLASVAWSPQNSTASSVPRSGSQRTLKGSSSREAAMRGAASLQGDDAWS